RRLRRRDGRVACAGRAQAVRERADRRVGVRVTDVGVGGRGGGPGPADAGGLPGPCRGGPARGGGSRASGRELDLGSYRYACDGAVGGAAGRGLARRHKGTKRGAELAQSHKGTKKRGRELTRRHRGTKGRG